MWRVPFVAVALLAPLGAADLLVEVPAIQATGDHEAQGAFYAFEYDKVEKGTGSAEWRLDAEEVHVERVTDARLFQALGNDHYAPVESTTNWWTDAKASGSERGQASYLGVYAYPGHDRPSYHLRGECLDAAPYPRDAIKPREQAYGYTYYQATTGHVFEVPVEAALVDRVCGDAFELLVQGAFVATTWEYDAEASGIDDQGRSGGSDATSGYYDLARIEDPASGDPVQQVGLKRQTWMYVTNGSMLLDVRGHHDASLVTATGDIQGPLRLGEDLALQTGVSEPARFKVR